MVKVGRRTPDLFDKPRAGCSLRPKIGYAQDDAAVERFKDPTQILVLSFGGTKSIDR